MGEQQEDKIITFERYYDPMLAHIIRTKLEDNGIPCFIADDNIIAANPILNQAVGGIKLKIFERDLERCRAILAEQGDMHENDHFEIDEATQEPVVCPYCASTNVVYKPSMDSKGGGIAGLFSTLAGLLSFKGQNDWYCYNCLRDFE